jgi:hypothetical protein
MMVGSQTTYGLFINGPSSSVELNIKILADAGSKQVDKSQDEATSMGDFLINAQLSTQSTSYLWRSHGSNVLCEMFYHQDFIILFNQSQLRKTCPCLKN